MATGSTGSGSSILPELTAAGDRSRVSTQADKKNYAEKLSRALATRVANGLRKGFPGILPNERGEQQESRARTSRGVKKLDVNYSTPELGLGLGVSIKTVNFRDPRTKRYTKNYTRVDNELRAEAQDYHERQPFAVMVAIVFLPLDSCDDGTRQAPSSFASAVQAFRKRGGRQSPIDQATLFEGMFLGIYDADGSTPGGTGFVDVKENPPRTGRPKNVFDFDDLIKRITAIYDTRNNPPVMWAEESE